MTLKNRKNKYKIVVLDWVEVHSEVVKPRGPIFALM